MAIVAALVIAFGLPSTSMGDVATSQIPKQLPAKKSKRVQLKANNLKATNAPTKLATTLPPKRRVQLSFDRPTLSGEQASVAIRDDKSSLGASPAVAQTIRKNDVKEAPLLEVINDENESSQLKQTMPDSDSYVGIPVAERKPLSPTVNQTDTSFAPIVVAESETTTKATLESANKKLEILPILTSTPAATPAAGTTATAEATTAAPAPPANEATLSPLELQSQPSIHPVPFTSAVTNLPLEVETVESSTPTYAGIPETEVALDSEKGAHESGYSTPGGPALKATFLIPHDEVPRRRIFVRTGYLDAKYSRLEGDLKNGATLFGVSVSQVFSKTEVRLGLDFAHGLDQAVTLRNMRMAMFRAEGFFTFLAAGRFQAFAGGAIGLANIEVTSYRASTTGGEAVLKENAKGTALLASPELGGRARIGRELSIDLSAQYLLFAGSDSINRLGGLLGELALGFCF